MSPTFARVLHEEATRARTYRSRHCYSLEEMGMDSNQIVAQFWDVFERFGFDTRGDAK
jgi:hypothetical protein